MHDEYGVFLGLDVGKTDYHAVALNRDGKRLHDAALPNTEAGLRKLFDKLARHGRILAVVDQAFLDRCAAGGGRAGVGASGGLPARPGHAPAR